MSDAKPEDEFGQKYPEHAKLREIRVKAQAAGDFFEWLQERGYTICERVDHLPSQERDGQIYMLARKSRDTLLAEHFGIDEKRLDSEKDAMLHEHIRACWPVENSVENGKP